MYLPLANSKNALLGVEAKSCVPHVSEHLREVSQVIFFIFSRNNNVVHVREKCCGPLGFLAPSW
jgi:hypothetical protein